METTLEGLCGKHVLEGVDFGSERVKREWSEAYENCEVIRFQLDGVVYMAIEDPSDGYRSAMQSIKVTDEPIKNRFPGIEVVGRMKERSEYGQNNDTLQLISAKTGKTILEVGTDNHDDYYPCWVASWQPENAWNAYEM
jgi:hypothetical protein